MSNKHPLIGQESLKPDNAESSLFQISQNTFNIVSNSWICKILPKFLALGVTSVLISAATASKAQAENYLPYPADKTYQVTQSWQSTGSHSDSGNIAYWNRYAVDFGMSPGQDVVAVSPGKVIRSSLGKVSGNYGGCDISYDRYARYVVVDHGNDVSSLYLHLSAENVSVGDTVRAGQVIGKSGGTGYVCGPHLHFSFQKTSTIGNSQYGQSIPGGFAETGNAKPVPWASYTSKNRGIPSVAMLVAEPTNRTLDSGGGTYPYLYPQPLSWNSFHKWELRDIGGGKYMIISTANNRPLDGGGENGGRAYLHPQQMPSNPYQQWKLEPARSGYMVINAATGRALDSGAANGTQVYMHPTPMSWNTFHVWKLQ
jgi:murein DD-endopeptidase MepM/ murein hydrolase activator NlpD